MPIIDLISKRRPKVNFPQRLASRIGKLGPVLWMKKPFCIYVDDRHVIID